MEKTMISAMTTSYSVYQSDLLFIPYSCIWFRFTLPGFAPTALNVESLTLMNNFLNKFFGFLNMEGFTEECMLEMIGRQSYPFER